MNSTKKSARRRMPGTCVDTQVAERTTDDAPVLKEYIMSRVSDLFFFNSVALEIYRDESAKNKEPTTRCSNFQ